MRRLQEAASARHVVPYKRPSLMAAWRIALAPVPYPHYSLIASISRCCDGFRKRSLDLPVAAVAGSLQASTVSEPVNVKQHTSGSE